MGSIEQMPEIETISKAAPIDPISIIDALKDGTLPTMLLYNERGLQLFETITYNDHYYLTNSEIEILERCAKDIAARIRGSTLIELGSGALRKTSLILQAMEEFRESCDYYALDLDRKELERSLKELNASQHFNHVRLHGLHADYNDIHKFLAKQSGRVTILWMGSSVGNFDRDEASKFMLSLKKSMKTGDSMLIGIDHRNDPEMIRCAYNDPEGDSEAFEMNALLHANEVMGYKLFKDNEWKYEGRYDIFQGRHEVNFVAQTDVFISSSHTIAPGTKIRLERSYKYSQAEVLDLLEKSELVHNKTWTDQRNLYSMHLASVAPAFLPAKPSAMQPLPSLQEWTELWKVWDIITLEMIPEEMLHMKPIDLRNPCIFYIGHIPTFLDIHLARVTDGRETSSSYTKIFERGIDPDVDDPTQCHSHSVLPKTWPDLKELLQYRDSVRLRLNSVYESGAMKDRKVARAVFTGYEHEAMHVETLLYMLIQSTSTLPPLNVQHPMSFEAKELPAAAWIDLPASSMKIGMDDVEGTPEGSFFGWDNEKPSREVALEAFSIQSRPVTNGEYAKYLNSTTATDRKWRSPQSWTPDCRVKTVFGPVSMSDAVNWPVAASYDELAAYAKWAGARLPTYNELRHFIDVSTTTESSKDTPFNDVSGKAVNFRQWVPSELRDTAEPQVYTGVWEWTSSTFDKTLGFETSKIYPGYSEDFFDGKHNIVLGGSWATISRIAARKSFVNWYQRNYEFSWSGCRLVKI